MYLEALKIFCDVVRHRSFSKAAALNHISQSAASQNVLQLEKTLGVRLIDRSKRPFELTREGQVYYDGCRNIVERYYAGEEQVETMRKEIDRQLRKHDVDVHIIMAFDNIETIKRAVELGEGVSILPEPAIQHEVRTGTVVAIPLTSPTLIRPLGILHRKSGELSRTASR